MPLDVVYEDEHLLVVDKPAGLVVHPAPGHDGRTAVHGLVELGAAGGDAERPGIVHRLDRDTSGLLVVARSEAAHARLTEAIRERLVERSYLVLVAGVPRSRTGRIDAPVGPGSSRPYPPLDRHRHAAGRRHVVRGARAPRHTLSARGTARDRAHAPDPRPPRSGRAACQRTIPSTGSRATSASRGSSSTRTGSRSTIPSPASGSSSRRPLPARSRGTRSTPRVRRPPPRAPRGAKCPTGATVRRPVHYPATPPDGGAWALRQVPSAPAGASTSTERTRSWQSSP